jgi:hypothetical protein
MSVQAEPEQLEDDDLYELDRRAWNLPRPRPQLAIAHPSPGAESVDRSGYGSHSKREAEPGA